MKRGEWRRRILLGGPVAVLTLALAFMAQLRPVQVTRLKKKGDPSAAYCALQQLNVELTRHHRARTVTVNSYPEGVAEDDTAVDNATMIYDRSSQKLTWIELDGNAPPDAVLRNIAWEDITEEDVTAAIHVILNARNPMLSVVSILNRRGSARGLNYNWSADD